MIINRNTPVILGTDASTAVTHAAKNLRRDLKAVCTGTDEIENRILLEPADLPDEAYEVRVEDLDLVIRASGELGFVYGIYEVSREILGVENFWFWNDQRFVTVDHVTGPEDYVKYGAPSSVRFRGWFINDEVLIQAWSVEGKKEKPWEMVFEALLRCGYRGTSRKLCAYLLRSGCTGGGCRLSGTIPQICTGIR
ncbi:MAG: glycosyl hydrolase 115 family protein [bacterium]|nr:glycosyl hydrolase 115 family protein [bacterium]MDY4099192.1 glycosyl hydrolase 115 family protein [Lachnospiraceae bacterium]